RRPCTIVFSGGLVTMTARLPRPPESLEPRHDQRLRKPPRSERSQLHATHAAVADRARRVRLSEPAFGRSRRPALHLGRNVRALAPTRFRAQTRRHWKRRHRSAYGGEHARDAGSAFWRANERR